MRISGYISAKILAILSILAYIFLWVPVIVLIVFSFSSDRFAGKWEHFTLKWYADFFADTQAHGALTLSLIIASITVLVATTLGTLTAYALYKYKFRGKNILRTTLLFPIVMPYIVTGASLLVFFTKALHMTLGLSSVILAHITFSIPLAVFIVLGRMHQIDWSVEEAALDLGASRITAFRKVIIPLLLPAIAASAMLIFPWSFDDFVITYFVAGVGTTTLPIYIFSMIRYGVTPEVNAIATLVITGTLIVLLIAALLQRKGGTAI